LPRLLLAVGSIASLAANVAVAEPAVTGRVIAAWPFALIGSYELLMRQVRCTACRNPGRAAKSPSLPRSASSAPKSAAATALRQRGQRITGQDLQRQAWQWALANRASGGSLPSGKAIAAR
jgi:hypothetical protein